MSNIFENFDKAKKELDDRAMHIARIAKSACCGYSFDIIPHMHDYTARLIMWVEETYPPNPNYDPNADHNLPENKEKQTGFSWLHVKTNKAILTISEIPDQYEDFETAEWQVVLPFELALNGTDEEIESFFKKHFEKDVDRQTKLNNEQLYNSLFQMDANLIDKIIKHKDFSDNDSLDYKIRNKILLECGVNVFNRK